MILAGKKSQSGVTLIEMIVVIVVSGILISIAAMFVRNQVTSYFDVARRAELTDIADGALRRIARDVQGSLPNSVRPQTGGGSTFIEFVPVVDAGRFATQDSADLSSPLVVQGPAVDVAVGQQLVICNTGQASADVYAGNNRRELTAGSALVSLAFAGAPIGDFCSSNRFYVVGATPVVYAFDGNARTLWRFSGCPMQQVQLQSIAALTAGCAVRAALATSVAEGAFNFVANAAPSLGVLTVRLVLSAADAADERVTLLQQINLSNSP